MEQKNIQQEEWALEELDNKELDLLSDELMAWCGIGCAGHITI